MNLATTYRYSARKTTQKYANSVSSFFSSFYNNAKIQKKKIKRILLQKKLYLCTIK